MQKIPLKANCDPSCKCGVKEIKNWKHAECQKQAYVNNKGVISCDNGCQEYCLKNVYKNYEDSSLCQDLQKYTFSAAHILLAFAFILQSIDVSSLNDSQKRDFMAAVQLELLNSLKN